MKKVNVGWNEYFKPTPTNVRKFGDSLMMISGMIVLFTPAKWVVAVGIGGKILSNFFSKK